MNTINLNAKVSGEYNICITKADGSIQETGWFDNLILNAGLDKLGSGTSPIGYCSVGSGTSVPSPTQTALDARLVTSTGYVTSAQSAVNSGSPLYQATLTYANVFSQGAVVGNISEVGVGTATNGTALFSRALILNNVGAPTTLTLVALDQLTVYYRIKFTPTLTESVGTINISGTSYGYTLRPSGIDSFVAYTASLTYLASPVAPIAYITGSALGAITGSPTLSGYSGTGTNYPYVPGTYEQMTSLQWGITQGTVPFQAIKFGWAQGYIMFQVRFDMPIPKSNTNVLTLAVKFSWSR